MQLSDKQRAILDFIRERLDRDGYPPSQLEIAAAFGFKQNVTANYHLRALEAAGAIVRTPGMARSIQLIGRRRATRPDQLMLPVLGRVAAGSPIGAAAELDSDQRVALDRTLFSPTPDYLLRVQGDSMREDGILDGDLVAVQRSVDARNGQIVIARIDDEITIKRLQRTKQRIRLLPRNPDFAPIEVPADADFAIEGLYCGLVRSGA
ncbi:MAG TPA: transcriptional repressor LexA [Rudaea sp.]|nr:transcriptional repressor LexA [Rudaea sp.]